MHNSHERIFLGLYEGIFKDAVVYFPGLSFEKDRNKFTVLTRTRGLRWLTVDLPAFGKHFDRCLSTGKLTPSGVPGFGTIGSGSSPKLLQGLISLVFDTDGVIRSEPCTLAIGFIRQLSYAAKKPKFECPSQAIDKAYEKYLCIERELPSPVLDWGDPALVRRDCHRVHMRDFHDDNPHCEISSGGLPSLLQAVADYVVSEWDHFDPYAWKPGHGPGAVADQRTGGDKYLFPTWSARLDSVFPAVDLASANYHCWLTESPPCEDREVPAMLLTVPKSQTKPRLIAKEPIGAMWCQQIIRRYIEAHVKVGLLSKTIHFNDQSFNGRLALESSSTGSHATIDLSDASDRLSLRLVERLFRRSPSLLEALCAARSRHIDMRRGSLYSEPLLLKKFAPQGSATTFPMQSVSFAIMAIASVIWSNGQSVTRQTIRAAGKQVLVFGDDTIIPSEAAETYVKLLTWGGLSVNHEKTFLVGKFRESCGTEAYDGVDVTPSYLTKPLVDLQPEALVATVACSNNFFNRGLWHAAQAILAPIPSHFLREIAVVANDSGVFGLQSYCGYDSSRLLRSYNSDLQRDEVRAYGLSTRATVQPRDGHQSLLQFFIEEPHPDTHWESGVRGRPNIRLKRGWGAEDDYLSSVQHR